MKLIKMNKPEVSESREVPGLLACRIEYEVKTAKGRLAARQKTLIPD